MKKKIEYFYTETDIDMFLYCPKVVKDKYKKIYKDAVIRRLLKYKEKIYSWDRSLRESISSYAHKKTIKAILKDCDTYEQKLHLMLEYVGYYKNTKDEYRKPGYVDLWIPLNIIKGNEPEIYERLIEVYPKPKRKRKNHYGERHV